MWTLIIFYTVSNNFGSVTSIDGFRTKELCETARQVIESPQGRSTWQYAFTRCVTKQ